MADYFYDFSTEKEFRKYCNAKTEEERVLHKARFLNMVKKDVEDRLERKENKNDRCKCNNCKCSEHASKITNVVRGIMLFVILLVYIAVLT